MGVSSKDAPYYKKKRRISSNISHYDYLLALHNLARKQLCLNGQEFRCWNVEYRSQQLRIEVVDLGLRDCTHDEGLCQQVVALSEVLHPENRDSIFLNQMTML